jgi:hypothetical protein
MQHPHNGLNGFSGSREFFYRASRKGFASGAVPKTGESLSGDAPGSRSENDGHAAAKRSEPMLKKIVLAAALASGAIVAVPAVAQTVNEGVMINRVVEPDGSMMVTRRFTEPDGRIVDVTRTYRWDHVGVAPITPWHHYEGNSVSGGVGGAIGGYYIVGTTPADNKPLPPQWSTLPYSYAWPAPSITVIEPPAG